SRACGNICSLYGVLFIRRAQASYTPNRRAAPRVFLENFISSSKIGSGIRPGEQFETQIITLHAQLTQ
ncbi:MAG: hypothetical protein ACLQVD_03045, partial [Capsulimonadaceae bacterium]